MHGIKKNYGYFMELNNFYYFMVINSQQALNLG